LYREREAERKRVIMGRMSRWIAAGGAFVVSLDSMANIAFPAMTATFAVGPEQMRWVIICYVGIYALIAFVAGALADVLGHGRVFRAGLALSALGFLVVGLGPRFAWVLVGRGIQGLGGGMVYGTAPGIVTLAAAPGERGRALGFFNAAFGTAFALGPLLAGVMVQTLGWRSVFHARVPLALLILAWALVSLPRAAAGGTPRLVTSREVLRPEIVHAGMLAFVANAGIFAVWLLAPFYLVTRRGLEPGIAGAVFMLTPLGTALAAPMAGRLADRIGPRAPMVAGLALEALGLGAIGRADGATPLALVAVALFATGLGIGVFQVPNMAWIMAAFPAGQQGAAGGVAFFSRTLGVVAGVLGLSAVFGARRASVGFDAAFAGAFTLAAVAVGIAVLLALRAPGPRAGERARLERRAEVPDP
jgi:MFS family permease